MINRHFKNIKPTFSNFKKLSELWPIVIIWPTILGYLAFNIYASKHGITYADVDIHLIVGLGLFNMVIMILIYYSGLIVKRHIALNSLTVTYCVYFFTLQPLLILFILLFGLQYNAFSNLKSSNKSKKKTFSQLRKIALKQHRYELFSMIFSLTLVLATAFFINTDLLIVWIFIYFSNELIQYFKNNFKKQIYYLSLITLLTPFVTTLYVLDDVKHTFFGISNHIVEIKTEEELIRGQMNYQSADFIFLSNDSTNIKIPISKVESITQIDGVRKPDNYYDKFKDWFSEE